MENLNLNFSNQEKLKITNVARQTKFQFDISKDIYELKAPEILGLFNKCVRFFENLQNVELKKTFDGQDVDVDDSSEVYDSVKEKITSFLNETRTIVDQSIGLLQKYNSANLPSFKRNIAERLDELYNKYRKEINYSVDKFTELGKNEKYYDPDKTQGYT